MSPTNEHTPELPGAVLAELDGLRRLARGLVRDEGRAEDAVQETLLRFWKRSRDGGAPREGRRWLSRVLVNAVRQDARTRERRAGREAEAAPPGGPESPREVARRVELQRAVVDAVLALEEPYRTTVHLRFLDGRKPREVARLMGCPVKTVHTRTERGLAQLRGRLDERFGERAAWSAVALPLAREPLASAAGAFGVAAPLKVAVAAAAAVAAVAAVAAITLDRSGSASPVRESGAGGVIAATAADDPALPPSGDLSRTAALVRPPDPPGSDERVRVDAGSPAAPAPVAGAEAPRLDVLVVSDATGRAIPGAFLLVEVGDSASHARADALGRLSPEVRAGAPVRLVAVPRPGLQPSPGPTALDVAALRPGEVRRVELRVRDAFDREFYGRVVDAGTGEPIADAAVRWVGAGEAGSDEPAEPGALTDPGGFFPWRFASWRPAHVRIDAAGYSPAVVALRSTHELPESAFEVRLPRAGALELELTGWERWTAPLVRATVEQPDLVQPAGMPTPMRALRWSAPPAHGATLRLEGLPAGVPIVLDIVDGPEEAEDSVWQAPTIIDLAPGETRRMAWVLGTGLAIEGRVLAAGGDVAGFPVRLTPVTVASDGDLEYDPARMLTSRTASADGRFEARDLGAGTWVVGTDLHGPPEEQHSERGHGSFALAAPSVVVELDETASPVAVVLEAERALPLRGRVVRDSAPILDPTTGRRRRLFGGFGASGSPDERTYVRAEAEDGITHVQVLAADDGTFDLGLVPRGEWTVQAWRLGALGLNGATRARAGDVDVEVSVGRGVVVAGRVLDELGRPIEAHVHLVNEQGSLGMTTTDSRFAFEGLTSGVYSLQASTADGRVAFVPEVSVRGEHQRFDLRVEQGARVRVVFTGDWDGRCRILVEGRPVADSSFGPEKEIFEDVPPRELLVELYDGDGVAASTTVRLESGEIRELFFQL